MSPFLEIPLPRVVYSSFFDTLLDHPNEKNQNILMRNQWNSTQVLIESMFFHEKNKKIMCD